MRLLFVKSTLAWPRSSGHDVFTYYTMKACAALGHEVSLATMTASAPHAVEGLPLTATFQLDRYSVSNGTPLGGTALQRRFRSFWGIPDASVSALQQIVSTSRPDAVVVAGLDALPYFPVLSGVVRVWFAADEWVWHHLSQLRFDARCLENLYAAAVKGLYERAHRRVVDRVWVVSGNERRAMHWLAGMRTADILPLGVDSDYFKPGDEKPEERTAVFWGRLDFGPNIQALEWFCQRVWPLVRRAVPNGRFTIVGFHPTGDVRRLASADGVSIVPDLQDLRSTVRQHAVVVLPFVSGGGVKNKLLEAAALGLPIVCTPLATQGLRAIQDAPFAVRAEPSAMAATIVDLWSDRVERDRLGTAARAWVIEHHTWAATAREAIAALERSSAASRCGR